MEMKQSQWAWIILMDNPCNYCDAYNYLGHCGTKQCSIPKEREELEELMDFLCVNPQELIDTMRFYEEVLDELLVQEDDYIYEYIEDGDYWADIWRDVNWVNHNC